MIPDAPPLTTVVITTLAEYQTRFWIPVARTLQSEGFDVFVCAFDDRSAEMLAASGVPGARMQTWARADPVELAERTAQYGIENLNLLFSHERVTFRIRDTRVLQQKFLAALNSMEAVFDKLRGEGRRVVLLQELGGYLSVIASFYAARARGVDNWFVEPSFFRGRLLFLKNTFQSLRVNGPLPNLISPEVVGYVEATMAKQMIVIPGKDRHQYRPAFNKIVDWSNVKRLAAKLYDKKVLGKRQEFSYIGTYVAQHVDMTINALRMKSHYTHLDSISRFIYYPLHVPADMALTLRSPEYLDQLAFLDYLLRVAPLTHRVVIKEHPAQVGALSASGLQALLRRYDNLAVLPPGTNNYRVLAAADLVVSINSKSGAEALMVGRPVVVLGDAFYSDWSIVSRVKALSDLDHALRVSMAKPLPSRESVYQYFQSAWDHSALGELYIVDPDNVRKFADSLVRSVLSKQATVSALEDVH
jgi:hypothetical protein